MESYSDVLDQGHVIVRRAARLARQQEARGASDTGSEGALAEPIQLRGREKDSSVAGALSAQLRFQQLKIEHPLSLWAPQKGIPTSHCSCTWETILCPTWRPIG